MALQQRKQLLVACDDDDGNINPFQSIRGNFSDAILEQWESLDGNDEFNGDTTFGDGATGLTNPYVFYVPGALGVDLAGGNLRNRELEAMKKAAARRAYLWEVNTSPSIVMNDFDISVPWSESLMEHMDKADDPIGSKRPIMRITTFLSYFLFLCCGIGYQIQFTSVTSAVVYFRNLYGPSIIRIFVAAFNAPLLFVLVAQLLTDKTMDRLLGSNLTYRVRIISSMVTCTAFIALLPLVASQFVLLVGLVGLLGIFNGIANGAYQGLVTIFPLQTTIFWSIGQRVATACVLCIQFFLFDPNKGTFTSVMGYYESCAVISLFGVICYIILSFLPSATERLKDRNRQLRYAQALEKQKRFLGTSPTMSARAKQVVSQLLVVWPTAIAGFLILFSDVAVLTALTYFPSSDNNSNLPLILLYISYFGDFIGRQATLLPRILQPVRNQVTELIAAVFRFAFIPITMFYINEPWFHSDYASYVFIGVFAILGGYIRTLIYSVGPQSVSVENRPSVSLILNISVTIGTYLGIIFAFTLGAYLESGALMKTISQL